MHLYAYYYIYREFSVTVTNCPKSAMRIETKHDVGDRIQVRRGGLTSDLVVKKIKVMVYENFTDIAYVVSDNGKHIKINEENI